MAVAPANNLERPRATRAPAWWHGMELSARRAGEADFNPDTKKYGIEVFRDESTGYLVYISETGSIAVSPAGNLQRPSTIKAPTWRHGMELRVRKAGEPDFNKETKKFGIEVFRDENNGNLIYISETGSIAVVHSPTTQRQEIGRVGP